MRPSSGGATCSWWTPGRPRRNSRRCPPTPTWACSIGPTRPPRSVRTAARSGTTGPCGGSTTGIRTRSGLIGIRGRRSLVTRFLSYSPFSRCRPAAFGENKVVRLPGRCWPNAAFSYDELYRIIATLRFDRVSACELDCLKRHISSQCLVIVCNAGERY